jgi:peptide methionine sulfoxide reductase msrA/msrB
MYNEKLFVKADMKLFPLTDQEVHKGTEAPFSGEYNDFFKDGVYTCKQCGTDLFSSADKFHSGCGWPSFDSALKEKVRQSLDADGIRTEITCATCGAHLGHVFFGEELTQKNTRHCVNSLSLRFVPKVKNEIVVFAGGCFWGVEALFEDLFGVIKTTVGYTGGHVQNPTYERVCMGTTGHAEALRIEYDPEKISFETLAKRFFEIHDPTQKNRQGPDIGSQYRSAIFYTNENQKHITETLIKELQSKGIRVETEVQKAETFYPAEEYHQHYYAKTGNSPSCHFWQKRF